MTKETRNNAARRFFSGMAALVLPLAMVFGACDDADKNSHKFVSKEKGFSIEFPEVWEVKRDVTDMEVIGLSPVLDAGDDYRENVYVAVSPLDKPMSADGVLDGIVPDMVSVITDFEPISRERTTLGGVEAASLLYQMRQGKFRLTCSVHALSHRDRAYLIYTVAESDQRQVFEPQFSSILNSFEVTK